MRLLVAWSVHYLVEWWSRITCTWDGHVLGTWQKGAPSKVWPGDHNHFRVCTRCGTYLYEES